MPRFEHNFKGYLAAFLAAHPEWREEEHQFVTDQPGNDGGWISLDLVREATRWARQQRYISWELATHMETICRRATDQLRTEPPHAAPGP